MNEEELKLAEKKYIEHQKNIIESINHRCRLKQCADCEGYVYSLDSDGRFYATTCGTTKEKRSNDSYNRLVDFARIPKRYSNNTFSNFSFDNYEGSSRETVIDIFKKAQYYVENFPKNEQGRGFYIYSISRGVGKTRLVTTIANELIAKHRTNVRFATSLEILNTIKGTFDNKKENEKEYIDALIGCDLLIIDDFGTEKAKDWSDERWYSIINARYQDCRPTIYTSNLTIDSLGYESRIKDRMIETSMELRFPEMKSLRRK